MKYLLSVSLSRSLFLEMFFKIILLYAFERNSKRSLLARLVRTSVSLAAINFSVENATRRQINTWPHTLVDTHARGEGKRVKTTER